MFCKVMLFKTEMHSSSADENSLIQFECLERQLNGSTIQTTPLTTVASSTLMAPLKVPDFKQNDPRPPLLPLTFTQKTTRPIFQSTPHNNKRTTLKPTTPGGHHQISPIPEEGELDRLVSELIDEHQQAITTTAAGENQQAVKSLITQLRDVIAQWDWAQARHRQVAKIYFERQNDELNARWEQLNTEMTKCNERKADEWAQIAKVRAELHAEREKRMGKKEAEQLKHLEQELTKLKSKDALASQRACELRTRIRELEGEVRVREQSYTDNMLRLKKLESQLVTAEQGNSNLRTRLTMLCEEAAKKKKQYHQLEAECQHLRELNDTRDRQTASATQNDKNNTLPIYRVTERGREYTIVEGTIINSSKLMLGTTIPTELGGGNMVITELLSCQRAMQNTKTMPRGMSVVAQQQPPTTASQTVLRHCVLYEWPSTRNFRWLSSAAPRACCASAAVSGIEKVQIDYLHTECLYEVRMIRGNLLRFLLNGRLELHWANGDRTLVLPDGERREFYNPNQPDFYIEIFMPTGTAYRLSAETQWLREEFVPDPARMSTRPDGSFVAEHVEDDRPINTDQNRPLPRLSLQINSPDFQLRRFAGKAVKLALDRTAGIQLWLCTDNVLLVKHVFNSRPTEKCVCFSYGHCSHIHI